MANWNHEGPKSDISNGRIRIRKDPEEPAKTIKANVSIGNENKETNPKDAVGTKKPPRSTIPQTVMAEVGVGMLEGARKYGRHNWRVAGIRYSVYYDATRRHLDSWWEGEDTDPDSNLSHVTKAICSLIVLRDAMIQDKCTDDRPPKSPEWHKKYVQEKVEEIFSRHPEAKQAFVEGDQYKD